MHYYHIPLLCIFIDLKILGTNGLCSSHVQNSAIHFLKKKPMNHRSPKTQLYDQRGKQNHMHACGGVVRSRYLVHLACRGAFLLIPLFVHFYAGSKKDWHIYLTFHISGDSPNTKGNVCLLQPILGYFVFLA